jgi:hypothetical protein
MDTVIGAKGRGEKVLLTICFPKSEIMLAYIRDANTAKSVTDAFEQIKTDVGYDRFCELFPLILTDYAEKKTIPKNHRSIGGTGAALLIFRHSFCSIKRE